MSEQDEQFNEEDIQPYPVTKYLPPINHKDLMKPAFPYSTEMLHRFWEQNAFGKRKVNRYGRRTHGPEVTMQVIDTFFTESEMNKAKGQPS